MIKTKTDGLLLRFADEEDIPQILSFIKDLAEYEKMSNQVITDENILKKNLFGEKKFAEVIIAEYDHSPAGFGLFFYNFSTFIGKPGLYLEDLYVKPEYRGKGIGKTLLSYLAKLAVEKDCGRFEWAVLDWNEPAINFYKSFGAVPQDEWTVFRVTNENLGKLAELF